MDTLQVAFRSLDVRLTRTKTLPTVPTDPRPCIGVHPGAPRIGAVRIVAPHPVSPSLARSPFRSVQACQDILPAEQDAPPLLRLFVSKGGGLLQAFKLTEQV